MLRGACVAAAGPAVQLDSDLCGWPTTGSTWNMLAQEVSQVAWHQGRDAMQLHGINCNKALFSVTASHDHSCPDGGSLINCKVRCAVTVC